MAEILAFLGFELLVILIFAVLVATGLARVTFSRLRRRKNPETP